MGKIFCIMGKSSSGKDTLYQLILNKWELHLSRIILYTTRPRRHLEEDGREYYFVDEMPNDLLFLEKRQISVGR